MNELVHISHCRKVVQHKKCIPMGPTPIWQEAMEAWMKEVSLWETLIPLAHLHVGPQILYTTERTECTTFATKLIGAF